jgi:hypothetical protein
MDIYEDILNFFDTLNQNQVKYILIGGFAVNLHGYSRAIGDIDIWLHDTTGNRANFIDALDDLNIDEAEAFADISLDHGSCCILLDNGFHADIIAMPKGMEAVGFSACYNAAEKPVISGLTIPFLHFNHLIESKKAAGRLKDLLDIEELEKIRQQKK